MRQREKAIEKTFGETMDQKEMGFHWRMSCALRLTESLRGARDAEKKILWTEISF